MTGFWQPTCLVGRALIIALAIGLPRAAAQPVSAAQPVGDSLLRYDGPPRAGDSVWIVDTTEVSKLRLESPGLDFKRYDGLDWAGGKIDTMLAEDAHQSDGAKRPRTVVFVHGYDYTPEKAEKMGWAVYHTLVADLPADQRVRFVIWSWPSTGIKFRMVRDMKAKMHRAQAEAYFLAWFLSRVETDTVIGTAMGCRIVSGSFQLLAGEMETLNTRVGRDIRRNQLRAVLVSAAIEEDWLLPDRVYGKALDQVKHTMLINNSMDPMLANFGMVSTSDTEALGVVGVQTETLGERANRLSQHDLATTIGREHGIENYLKSPEASALLREFVVAQ